MDTNNDLILWAATVRNKTFEERIEAAKAGGFTEMSAFPIDIRNWERQGKSIKELNQLMRDAGIKITILDPLTSWVPSWEIPVYMNSEDAAFIDFSSEEFLRMARELEVDKISLIEPFGKEYDWQKLQQAFNDIVDKAGQYGLKAQVEFMPFSAISSLEKAWKLVETSGRENAGLVFDTWHYFRGETNDELLHRIPGEKIFSLQLADAEHTIHEKGIFFDLLHYRKPPLQGDFPLVKLRNLLEKMDGLQSIGIELFSDRFDSLSTTEIGTVAKESINLWLKQEQESQHKLLMQKIRELCQATLDRDSIKYNLLLDEDFVGISFNGKRVGKQLFSDAHLKSKHLFNVFSTSEIQARIVENIGVVDGIIKIGHVDSDVVQMNRFSAILTQTPEDWRFMTWQDSPINEL